MIESSLRPARRPARGNFSRRQQVREAIGEARAALQETWGAVIPTPHPFPHWVRRWVFRLEKALAGLKQQLSSGRRRVVGLVRYSPTLVVFILLGITMASQGFGVYTAYMAPEQNGEGGIRLFFQAQEPAQENAFAFAAAPMTVAQRRPAEDTAPPQVADASSPGNVLARTEVVTYTVSAGDTLDAIAERFDVAPYTIFWVNELHSPLELEPGMVLVVPPLSGVPHTVQAGETLDSIADLYGVRPGNIVGYPPNELKFPYHLRAGQEVFVPGGIIEIPNHRVADGERPAPTLVKMPGGEKLSWPTWGDITAPFGWSRHYGGYHDGLDIGNNWGTPIYAAAGGTVVEAGWGGLGWYVVIDHGNGFRTEYGHMAERPLVSEGEEVERGRRIGSMGRTYGQGGYATGVHLHFGVRHHGVYIDPLPLLER